MLKIFRITLYALGGFCVYIVNLISFTYTASFTLSSKLLVMALFGIIGLLPMLAAMATNRFREWQVPVGAAMLSGVGVTLFVIFTVLCMELSPELLKAVPNFPQNILSDYLVGGITTVSLLVAGIALVRSAPETSNRRRNTG
jgi:hypothetical protein